LSPGRSPLDSPLPPACCKSLFSQPLLFAFLTPFLRVALEKSKIGTKAELRFRKKVAGTFQGKVPATFFAFSHTAMDSCTNELV
jgi:hypothetical protein